MNKWILWIIPALTAVAISVYLEADRNNGHPVAQVAGQAVAQIGAEAMAQPVEELRCKPGISYRDLTWQPFKSDVKAGRMCEPYGPPRPLEPRPCQWGNTKGVQWVFTDESGQLIQATECRLERN